MEAGQCSGICTTEIFGRILELDRLVSRKQRRESELRRVNRDGCVEIMSELDLPLTYYASLLLFFVRELVPVSDSFLGKVRETATDDEIRVLRKHGIEL